MFFFFFFNINESSLRSENLSKHTSNYILLRKNDNFDLWGTKIFFNNSPSCRKQPCTARFHRFWLIYCNFQQFCEFLKKYSSKRNEFQQFDYFFSQQQNNNNTRLPGGMHSANYRLHVWTVHEVTRVPNIRANFSLTRVKIPTIYGKRRMPSRATRRVVRQIPSLHEPPSRLCVHSASPEPLAERLAECRIVWSRLQSMVTSAPSVALLVTDICNIPAETLKGQQFLERYSMPREILAWRRSRCYVTHCTCIITSIKRIRENYAK